MESKRATVVVESRLLVREALKSLIAKHSCDVVCDVSSATEINTATISEEPELVVVGAQSVDEAVVEAAEICALWPDTKVVLLFQHISAADFQKLLTSQIDGCVPLFASPETLIHTLDLIVTGGLRVMVTGDVERSMIQPDERHQPEMQTLRSDDAGREAPSSSVAASMAVRNHTWLSEREVEILNGLVKGHANKVIARACDITEATVKVHVKAILRKIRVSNRTQAAIWALEHGYGANETTPGDGRGPLRINGADFESTRPS